MMKVAISGKGGVGKTTLAAILSYIFARDGYKVIAIDCDPSMNLPYVLGINNFTPLSNLRDLIRERVMAPMGIFKLNPDVGDVFEKYSVVKYGVKVLVLGTIEKGGEGCFCPESAFLRAVMRHAIFREEDIVIMDMEAGIEHLGRGTARGVDLLIVVVDPSLRSIETLRRIEKLSRDIGIERICVVVNKFIDEYSDILDLIDLPILGIVRYNDCFIKADISGVPPFKVCDIGEFERIRDEILTYKG